MKSVSVFNESLRSFLKIRDTVLEEAGVIVEIKKKKEERKRDEIFFPFPHGTVLSRIGPVITVR